MTYARLDLSKRKFWQKRLRHFNKVVRNTANYMDSAMRHRDQFGLMVDFMRCCHKWYEFACITESKPWLVDAGKVFGEINRLAERILGCTTIYEVIDYVIQLTPEIVESFKHLEYATDWTGSGHNGETVNALRRWRMIKQHRFSWCDVPDDYFTPEREGNDELNRITQDYLAKVHSKLIILMEPLANQAYACNDYQARFDFNCHVVKSAYEKELKHERYENDDEAAGHQRNAVPVAAHERQLAG